MESLTSRRLKTTTSHFMNRLDATKGGVGIAQDGGVQPQPETSLGSAAERMEASRLWGARHSPGLVARAYMPLLEPGSYVLKLPDLQVQSIA